MKEFFPGHFPKDSAEHRTLWENCLFVFDTNILLNMYRYSDETRENFIATLDKLKSRIWIPHRVAEEYLANRLKVISEQQEEYSSAINEVGSLNKKLDNPRQHPFVSKETMTAVEKSLTKLIKELEINRDLHGKRMHDDEIMSLFAIIFEGKVGRELQPEELELIIKNGEKRYLEKIPPGYSDAKKSSNEEFLSARCRPYGDLIVWEQIMEKSRESKAPVIFVTDDGKEDWWLRFKGKTLGPRPELLKEFKLRTGMDFHMYHPEKFLSLAGELLEQKTSDEILQEIRDVRHKESEAPQQLAGNESNIHAVELQEYSDSLHEQQRILRAELMYFKRRAQVLDNSIADAAMTKEATRLEALEFAKHQTSQELESSEQYLNFKSEYEAQSIKMLASQEELKSVQKAIKDVEFQLDKTEQLLNETNYRLAHYRSFKSNFKSSFNG